MKKFLALLLSLLLVGSLVIGCAGNNTEDEGAANEQVEEQTNDEQQSSETGTYEDGVYFAQEDEFAEGSGYKYFVVLNVEGGKITDAHWGGTHIQPKGNKHTLAKNGEYGMAKVAKAGEWDVQAQAAIDWLIENQDPTKMTYTTDEGHTDVLKTDDGATVSIHVIEFFELAKKALDAGPVEKGEYETPEDYVATATLDAGDWEYRLDLIIVNGRIMDSNMNAVFAGEFNDENAKYFADGDETKPLSKKELGEAYGMGEVAKEGEWDVQAERVDAFVEETQGFDIEYIDDKGHTDTISGVTIHVNEYEELFNKALGK